MADSYAENMRRNAPEAERLDKQLNLLSENIGYLVHPSIRAKLPAAPVIADLGTGTGLFLVQLAEQFPKASLHGFDISPALYPSPQTLPSNVKLEVMDIKQPPSSSELNKYDLVHVRLIAAGIASTEWEAAVNNAVQLLKPGGAIQWEECNWEASQYYRGGVESSVHTCRKMAALFKEAMKDRFSHNWKILPQTFKTIGLVDVEEDIVSSDRIPETRIGFARNGMNAIFGWARLISARNAPGSLPMDELASLEQAANAEVESGCYSRYDVHVALAFKPN